ncbi:hypothetical protein QTN47_21885 [Danxiaibacter flavus]|uniref:Uncharacterized protein n=1 Tax=Danxiaibacter flavus TaxID=3049108 RepID=A0ABV3ZJW5_9BACT|nr:hypothetical protein QNM32_21890 [Chitinophagaceae bacterium DXS]
MKITLLLFTFLTFFASKNHCERLKDGVYLVKHTSKKGAVNYRLTISGEICTIQINDTITLEI